MLLEKLLLSHVNNSIVK